MAGKDIEGMSPKQLPKFIMMIETSGFTFYDCYARVESLLTASEDTLLIATDSGGWLDSVESWAIRNYTRWPEMADKILITALKARQRLYEPSDWDE